MIFLGSLKHKNSFLCDGGMLTLCSKKGCWMTVAMVGNSWQWARCVKFITASRHFQKPFSDELGERMRLAWLLRGTSVRQSSGVSHSLWKKREIILDTMTSKWSLSQCLVTACKILYRFYWIIVFRLENESIFAELTLDQKDWYSLTVTNKYSINCGYKHPCAK